ncbi:MAG: restriction endonuclease subunit S [Bacteroidota bacterium]
METMTEQINLNSLDKSSWISYRFDQIAKSISERVDPNKTDLEIYVGLEHLDGESIHIKKYGTPEDVKGQKLRCYPGDVIFGKRRAYQRKAAIVDFEGICSAHAMVLRANPEVIDPKLFPFFLHSDAFMHRAVDISVGSLSPTINWKTLRVQEFLLPPKDQQAQLAELLWAMDEVVEREREVLEKLEKVKFISNVDAFTNGKLVNRVESIRMPNDKWELLPIGEVVLEIEYGISISIPNNQDDNGIPIISTAEIDREGRLNYSIIRKIKYDKLNERLTLKSGDVLFNWRNSIDLIGKTTVFKQPKNDNKPYTFASFILRLRCDEIRIHNKYIFQLLNFYRVIGIFTGLARKAVNQANFNKNELRNLLIPIPPYNEQLLIMKRLNRIESMKSRLKSKLNMTKTLQKSLINQIF